MNKFQILLSLKGRYHYNNEQRESEFMLSKKYANGIEERKKEMTLLNLNKKNNRAEDRVSAIRGAISSYKEQLRQEGIERQENLNKKQYIF